MQACCCGVLPSWHRTAAACWYSAIYEPKIAIAYLPIYLGTSADLECSCVLYSLPLWIAVLVFTDRNLPTRSEAMSTSHSQCSIPSHMIQCVLCMCKTSWFSSLWNFAAYAYYVHACNFPMQHVISSLLYLCLFDLKWCWWNVCWLQNVRYAWINLVDSDPDNAVPPSIQSLKQCVGPFSFNPLTFEFRRDTSTPSSVSGSNVSQCYALSAPVYVVFHYSYADSASMCTDPLAMGVQATGFMRYLFLTGESEQPILDINSLPLNHHTGQPYHLERLNQVPTQPCHDV